jgi:hypothetical protein
MVCRGRYELTWLSAAARCDRRAVPAAPGSGEQGDASVADLVYVVLTIALFVILALAVRAVERL